MQTDFQKPKAINSVTHLDFHLQTVMPMVTHLGIRKPMDSPTGFRMAIDWVIRLATMKAIRKHSDSNLVTLTDLVMHSDLMMAIPKVIHLRYHHLKVRHSVILKHLDSNLVTLMGLPMHLDLMMGFQMD